MPRSIFGWRKVTSFGLAAVAVGAAVVSCAQVLGLGSIETVACVLDCGVDAKHDTFVAPVSDACHPVVEGGCCENSQCNPAHSPNNYCVKSTGACAPCLPRDLVPDGGATCPSGTACFADSGAYSCATGCQTALDCPTTDAGPPECCGTTCVYTKNDPLNCGACGQKCSNNGIDNPTCVDGGCSGTCNSGFAACPDDAGKVNRLTNGCGTQVSLDPNNCGHCGLVCSGFNMADAAGHCDKSECQAECVSPYAYCGDAGIHPSDASHDGGDAGDAHVVAPAVYPTLAEAGCNINLNSDIYNCGACGRVCNQLHVQTVQCKFSPDAGIAECLDFCENGWGACNNPQQNGCDTFVKGNDPNNCSGCGTKSAPYPCCGGQPNTSGQPCTIEAGI